MNTVWVCILRRLQWNSLHIWCVYIIHGHGISFTLTIEIDTPTCNSDLVIILKLRKRYRFYMEMNDRYLEFKHNARRFETLINLMKRRVIRHWNDPPGPWIVQWKYYNRWHLIYEYSQGGAIRVLGSTISKSVYTFNFILKLGNSLVVSSH